MSRDALVVGINSYQYLQNLNSAATDAEAIADSLDHNGQFRVRRVPETVQDQVLCVGSRTMVSVSELEDALIHLFKPNSTQVPETALFYFSGHGLRKDRGISEGFLASSDTNPKQGNWGLRLKWLRELLQASPVKQQIVWLDCCYSGELLNFAEADPGNRKDGFSRCFIAASRDYELAYEDLGSSYSVLTHALLEGLDPNHQADGVVTNFTLVEHLRKSLSSATQCPIYTNFGNQIILTGRGTESVQPLAGGICPYRGLQYFDFHPDDAQYFYGRTNLTDELLARISNSVFMAVLGASGSGKSSVLRAGLLYQLQLGQRISGSDRWQIYVFRPGKHPLQSLAETFLSPNLSTIDRAIQLAKAKALIQSGAVGLEQLITAVPSDRVILLIDQFEECFTLCQDLNERQQFFDCLIGTIDRTDQKLSLIIGMRADFFGKCTEQEYSGLSKRIQENLITVPPLNTSELKEAIVEPSRHVGIDVEQELVDQMISDVLESPGSLPLLQYTLTELWQQRTVERLSLSTYLRLGGVKGTLQKRATEIYETFNFVEKNIAKYIFLELTQLGEGTEDTRRQVRQSELFVSQFSTDQIQQVIQKLADAKLIVTNELIAKNNVSERIAIVDIAHESLIRHWPLLRHWVNEYRDALARKRSVEDAAQAWFDRQYAQDYLLTGSRLLDAENLLKNSIQNLPLSTLAQNFIRRSKQSHLRKRGRMVASIIVPFFSLIITGVITLEQQRQRQVQTLLGAALRGTASSQLLQIIPRVLQQAEQAEKRDNLESAMDSYRVVWKALSNFKQGEQDPNRSLLLSSQERSQLDKFNQITESALGRVIN